MVKVLNVSLFSEDIPSAASHLIHEIASGQPKKNRCISATGGHGLVFAQQNRSFRDLLNSFFINLPDGMPGVWVGRLKGAKKMKRCYGPDFFKHVLIKSSKTSITHFFCGGNPGVADELQQAVKKKFHNTNIVGTYCPPFLPVDEYDFKSIAALINSLAADVVWIGLSTPKQEYFAKKLAAHTNVHFMITVGAAFDFHTDRIPQAPRWLQHAGLEWLFRLMIEPRRLYKRYFEIVPLFIYYNLKELITFPFMKSNS